MQRRKQRFERVIQRFVHRFREMEEVRFVCMNGVAIIRAYRARPTYLEDMDSIARASASYEWIITNSTFNNISRIAGDEGLFDPSIRLEADGEIYRLDRLTPYIALGLGAGYRLLTQKVKESKV